MKNAVPALEIAGLRKSFGRGKASREVLGGVSLTVNEGEFVSLIGPSGSGKTTLFRLIGGLEWPDAGDIRIGGRPANGRRGLIAYMPQQASLMPWRTVAANVELALEIAGVPRREARTQSREWLARIGLGDYAESYPHLLSGGMQQRVSFLRALLSPQPLMCLDEPFGALDALTRLRMQRWLLSIWEQNRRAVLFVTHSIEEALLLSDRVLVLSPSPAAVIYERKVPFPRPRDEALWTSPEFNAIKQDIYERLQAYGELGEGAR